MSILSHFLTMDTLSLTVHVIKIAKNQIKVRILHFICKEKNPKKEAFNRVVGNTGFEPVTSCLSSKRSKPTELIAHKSENLQWRFSGR